MNKFSNARRQAGAFFLNTALATATMGSIAAVSMDWAAQQAAADQQRQQGYVFTRLNDAVGAYMTLLYPALTEQSKSGVDVIPSGCAAVALRYGISAAQDTAIQSNKCSLALKLKEGGVEQSYTVRNAFQPTVTELKELGLLDRGISDVPVIPTNPVVAEPDASGAASSTLASNRYQVVITPKCVGLGADAETCTNTNKALESVVFNVQPYQVSSYVQDFSILLSAAGPDAGVSGPSDASNVLVQSARLNPTGEFRSLAGGWSRSNPITQQWSYTDSGSTVTYQRGVDNIVMMRNGYDTAYWQMIRRDGSTPPTADWDFNGKNLTNVGGIEVSSGKIKGDFEVGGNQTVKGSLTVPKDPAVAGSGSGTFGGLLTALGDLLVKGATELQSTLTVVGKALFKDDVTMDRSLLVKGDMQVGGALTGTSATFTGALTADTLAIGSTQITKDGTLLGGPTGWGVATGAACSQEHALAQSTDGKVQICRRGAWAPLITSEDVVITAPGTGQTCSPEGAPGRLPDGTLAVCRNGQWEATTPGSTAEGAVCSVEGTLATTTASPNTGLVLLGCSGGKWTSKVFSLPKLAYGTEGARCLMNDELALDSRGYPSLLICKDGKWQPPGTQLLANMQLGNACTLDGVLASDIERTGLLVCKKGVWSKTTDPIQMGSSCSPNGREVTLANGDKLYCTRGAWSDLPAAIFLRRPDGLAVALNRPIKFNGEIYAFYHEPNLGGENTSQDYGSIAYWLTNFSGYDPRYIHTGFRTSLHPVYPITPTSYPFVWRDDHSTYTVQVATAQELYAITDTFGGRPPAWNFQFQDGTEVWAANRRDECDNGCGQGWSGGSGNWWDHVTVDLWNKRTFHRWNTDRWAVILKLQKRN